MVKNIPSTQKTQVLSWGREDLLEKGMVTHSNILTWRISWTEELGGLQSMGSKELETTNTFTPLYKVSFSKILQFYNACHPTPAFQLQILSDKWLDEILPDVM